MLPVLCPLLRKRGHHSYRRRCRLTAPALPSAQSVLFPITVVNSGDVPEQVGAEAPAPGY